MQQVSNRQLYALLHNPQLERSVRLQAQWLWDQRNIPADEATAIAAQYNALFPPATPLAGKYILLTVIFPFAPLIFILQAYISARLLSRRGRKKWYSYWCAVCVGLLLYLVLLLIFARMYIVR